jgi:integrase
MNQFTPSQLDTAFVQPGTPMLSDVMREVEVDPGLSRDRRRDILSGLRRMAKALGRRPEDVPADARWLQPRLERIAPASLGISPKSWSNLLSDARAGLVLHGVVARRISRKADLSPEWSRLWGIVLASGDPTLTRTLSRFVHFLNRLGVEPEEVTTEHAEAYRDALEMNEISRPPDDAHRKTVTTWNLAVERVPDWPRRKFSLPSRSRTFTLGVEAFPIAFGRDLDRYLDGLLSPDPFDPEAVAVPLRPASVKQYRSQLLRFASALVHAGEPAGEIDGLAALVTVERVETGLRWMLKRTDERPSTGVSDMINVLKIVAKRHVRVDEVSQMRLDRMDARLATKSDPSLTVKNRERLRPLEDPATLRRLLLLPRQLFDRSIRERERLAAALAQEEAIAMAILIHCPIRRGNLTAIHLERNLQRPGDGRVFLVFGADEVKNGRDIEFELPRAVVDMIDAHLSTRSPRLCRRGTPWLFPRRDGDGPTSPTYLATRVKARILRETGLVMNMHLFRHLACKILLDAKPGHYEVARRLLGHSSLSTTLNAYAGFEAGTATRLFAEAVDAATR